MKIFNNRHAGSALKIIFGLSLLGLLFKSGKLDLKAAFKIFSTPDIFMAVLFCFLAILYIGSLRWKTILEFHTTVKFSQKDIFFIQWVGGFFSSALPGAVTGDLIKLGYIKRHDPSLSKRYLVFSVLIDRLLGLLALLLIAGIGSFLFYVDLISISPKFEGVIFINSLLFIVVLVGVGFFFIPKKIQKFILEKINSDKVYDFFKQVWSLSDRKRDFVKLFMLSVGSHIFTLFAFHLLNLTSYQSAVEFKYLTTIIPLGQVATAIPISPSGLGVGHAAYQKLFEYLHQANGATLFNNFWVFSTTFFVMGSIPYFFMSYNHKISR